MRKAKVWWTILTGIGSAVRMRRQADMIFRYYVLEALSKIGLFDYLKTPRTYGQLLAEFGFVDSEYTRELLDILVADKQNMLIKEEDRYRRNSECTVPQIDEIVRRTDKRIRNFALMAQGMTRYVPPRLRNEPIEFSNTFEQDGRQLLSKFDHTLGSRVYTTIRNASFAMLTKEEMEWLPGKTLLDVGCGSGRESAEIWMRFNGNIHITGIDPVASLLELADQNFPSFLSDIDPHHSPLNDSNRPTFQLASATQLPFEDNSFDAAFHSLVLHWTPEPRRAISEIARVLKPGGLVFGSQATRPYIDPYFDIVIRTSENSHGFFWKEEYLRWYGEHGIKIETITPVGIFRGHKPYK